MGQEHIRTLLAVAISFCAFQATGRSSTLTTNGNSAKWPLQILKIGAGTATLFEGPSFASVDLFTLTPSTVRTFDGVEVPGWNCGELDAIGRKSGRFWTDDHPRWRQSFLLARTDPNPKLHQLRDRALRN